MSRPKKKRIVFRPPLYADYKPIGVQRVALKLESLGLDEFEAIRLVDYLGMEHLEAAVEMEISRSTLTRLIEKARGKIARFLVEGKHLQVGGGNIHFKRNLIRCHDCSHLFHSEFEVETDACPTCGSRHLIDLAGGFGHGHCCRKHGNS